MLISDDESVSDIVNEKTNVFLQNDNTCNNDENLDAQVTLRQTQPVSEPRSRGRNYIINSSNDNYNGQAASAAAAAADQVKLIRPGSADATQQQDADNLSVVSQSPCMGVHIRAHTVIAAGRPAEQAEAAGDSPPVVIKGNNLTVAKADDCALQTGGTVGLTGKPELTAIIGGSDDLALSEVPQMQSAEIINFAVW